VLGPCVTCHVGQASETKRHIPIPVDRSGNLLSTVCNKCHSSTNVPPLMSTAALKSEKDGYEASLAVLAKVLKDRGFSYVDAYPNFTNTNWKTNFGTYGGFGDAIVPRTGGLKASVVTMGAAFNFNLLWHDYGAYAHNRYYAKRLIFDSIDWIINKGVLTTRIENALNALPSTPATPGELLFTKPDGVTNVYYNDTVRTNAIQYLQGGPGGTRP